MLERKYHGQIDLILETEAELLILDFKSDLLRERADEIKAHYQRQLGLYVDALEELVEKPVRG